MENHNIYVIYGDNPRDMVKEILQKTGVEKELHPDMKVGIKPNLINARPAEEGGTTSPELVEGIIKFLQNLGIKNIEIMEGSWVGADTEQAFEVCGYKELARKYGIDLSDLKKDSFREININDLKLKICSKPLAVDYLIDVPVLKAHCQTRFTCALKNLKGCIPDGEKRRYHSLGLHKPIAYLGRALPVDLVIVDAVIGDLTFEEGGNPVRMNRIILGKNPVKVDSYGASLIGYHHEEIEYLKIAEEIGVGRGEFSQEDVIEFNTGRKSGIDFHDVAGTDKFSGLINQDQACSACYGSIIHALQRLEEAGKLPEREIYVGQSFRGQKAEGIGIGNCTAGFSSNLPGCPPSAEEIRNYLTAYV